MPVATLKAKSRASQLLQDSGAPDPSTDQFPDARIEMSNPWLSIPASEYDEHMAHPAVQQRAFLDRVFASALSEHKPRSVALLGCATGGGLEFIDTATTMQVTAVDLNPEFVKMTRQVEVQAPGYITATSERFQRAPFCRRVPASGDEGLSQQDCSSAGLGPGFRALGLAPRRTQAG